MANGRANHPMYREKSDSGEYNTDYQAMSAQQMEQHRQDEFDRQDAMLDNIHRGVKGLKNHAHAINDEVVRQNHEIDDISNRMDDAQDDLERGEANAREVNRRKAKTCKLYGVIGVLVVVEIVLSFV